MGFIGYIVKLSSSSTPFLPLTLRWLTRCDDSPHPRQQRPRRWRVNILIDLASDNNGVYRDGQTADRISDNFTCAIGWVAQSRGYLDHGLIIFMIVLHWWRRSMSTTRNICQLGTEPWLRWPVPGEIPGFIFFYLPGSALPFDCI